MTVKLVATDLDGTFLATDHTIRDDTLAAYHKAKNEYGVDIVICTGRDMRVARDAIMGMKPDANVSMFPGVYYHGALAYDKNEDDLVYTKYLDKEVVWKVVQEIYNCESDVKGIHKEHHKTPEDCSVLEFDGDSYIKDDETFILNLYKAKGFSTDFETPNFLTFCEKYKEWHGECLNRRYVEEDCNEICHMSLVSSPCYLYQVKQRLLKFIEDTGAELKILMPAKECIHILNLHVNKANALQALCAIHNWHKDNTLAIGDSDNDIEMLEWANYGVAMGNAASAVKDHAKYQTSHSLEGGWGKAIEHLVFRQERGPIPL